MFEGFFVFSPIADLFLTQMDEIKKEILYSANDLQNAYMIHFRKISPWRSRIWIILSVVSFAAGLVLLLYSFLAAGFLNHGALFLTFYGVFLGVMFYARYAGMGKRMYKRMPDFKNTFTYVFTSEGVKVDSDRIHSQTQWEHFIKCHISQELILVYPNRYRFSFYCSRHFTREEFAVLSQWIQSKIPSAS